MSLLDEIKSYSPGLYPGLSLSLIPAWVAVAMSAATVAVQVFAVFEPNIWDGLVSLFCMANLIVVSWRYSVMREIFDRIIPDLNEEGEINKTPVQNIIRDLEGVAKERDELKENLTALNRTVQKIGEQMNLHLSLGVNVDSEEEVLEAVKTVLDIASNKAAASALVREKEQVIAQQRKDNAILQGEKAKLTLDIQKLREERSPASPAQRTKVAPDEGLVVNSPWGKNIRSLLKDSAGSIASYTAGNDPRVADPDIRRRLQALADKMNDLVTDASSWSLPKSALEIDLFQKGPATPG